VNAGMVPFKRTFLGLDPLPYDRAVTSQKCVRAGGKHNDLEQVGETARHHTFFEMLGNFSFGDYFKREAIGFAWELLTKELGFDPERLWVTVHHSDEEAAKLWTEVAGVPPERIYFLGDEDNFWQMADTGPCGPCSELHYDLREEGERGTTLTTEDFVEAGEAGRFIELWNLVFMQFDRDAEGTLHPLPAPSIDTGAGLERIAAVLQNVDSNYHTDLFLPLLERVGEVVGRPYDPESGEAVSFRVLADHARAVTFLLADGVFPANEGRGYVLRRILRRAVRHAWLLGRREPTLAPVVERVVDTMEEAYPELRGRVQHLLKTTRAEEERFLQTIEGGMERFEALAPPLDAAVRQKVGQGKAEAPEIPGEEVFRLYDTFGFPLDLTGAMARERGYRLDIAGFERALEEQRRRSRADRAAGGTRGPGAELEEGWVELSPDGEQTFVGYDRCEVETEVIALRRADGRIGLQLRHNPFYAEAGGQVSDRGEVRGDGWRMEVEEVLRVGGRVALFGEPEGKLPEGEEGAPWTVTAHVSASMRHDTERHHTATHLLHAALRSTLGEHVVQRGSLVDHDRLRFDFAHHAPLTPEEIREVEERVNRAIWEDHPLRSEITTYPKAVERGAMALFGEKYGDEVRLVEIPGVSLELCGGTHLRHTGEAGLFAILKESGIAAGVRRIEAAVGPAAFRHFRGIEEEVREVAALLKASPANLRRRVEKLVEERSELEALVEKLRSTGAGGDEEVVVEVELELNGGRRSRFQAIRIRARGADEVRGWGDAFLASDRSGVSLVAAEFPDGKRSLFTFVTADLVGQGIRADAFVREVAALVGSRGGGRPHMAQAGVDDPEKLEEALHAGADILRRMAGQTVS
jgi:alanyl-tRNA synthetase